MPAPGWGWWHRRTSPIPRWGPGCWTCWNRGSRHPKPWRGHSGENALGLWSSAQGQDAAAGGNLLAQEGVPQAMLDGFLASSGHLGDRLIAALAAGLHAGGEAGPVHSAGLLLVDRLSWPLAELRCDWTEACPIAAVTEAWAVYRPQMGAYVQRALDPRAAPSYGVPGDD